MADYLEPPVEVDPDELNQDSLEYLESAIPGFRAAVAGLVGYLTAATARMGAVGAEYLSAAMTTVFIGLGEGLHGVPRIRATSAQADSTWTMSTPGPHTIPAGLLVEVEGAAGNAAFEVVAQVEIADGETATDAGEVALIAVEQGAHTSGLAGPATLAEASDLPVASIVLTGVTSGGRDEETVADYLNNFTAELRQLTRTPILPEDFAMRARRLAGSGRALALDGYDPTDDSTDNERMVTVALRDDAGEEFSSEIRSAVAAGLEALREINFVAHVISGTYTTIDVAFEFVVYPGSDPATVKAAAEAAVAELLSPATHGQPPFGDQRTWHLVDTIRFQEVSTAINNTPGLDHWTTLTITEEGGTPGTADVALDGAAPLPRPGAIVGTPAA
jgi:hypothetical protein